MMRKQIFKTAALLVTVLSVLVSLIAFPVGAAGASGMDYAYRIKGGSVKNIDELIAAFTDVREGKEGIVYAKKVAGKENTVELTESVILTAPITITNGSYTIIGKYSTIYRGFDDGQNPMFLLVGRGDSAVKLTLEESGDDSNWTTPSLTLDGNSEAYSNSSVGMIMMKGRAVLEANKGVHFTNSSTYGYGGAIYAEIDESGTERTPLIPEIHLRNCKITDCKAEMGGGAVALAGYYSGTNGGLVEMKKVTLENNSAGSAEYEGGGGAIYSIGGEIKLDTVYATKNTAFNGGVIYTGSDLDLYNCTLQYNTATLDGGAIYGCREEGIAASVNIDESDISENSAQWNGGAMYINGSLEIKGMSIFSNNKAGLNGGCLYLSGTFNMNSGSIMSSKAGGIGGGVYIEGEGSVFHLKNGEINNGDAAFVSGVYCEGELDLSGGAIGNNKGDAPQVLIKGQLDFSGSAFVQNDVIGLCVTENNGKKNYPCVYINTKITTNVEQNIAFYSEKTDSDGNVKAYKNATKSGEYILIGNRESYEIFKVKSRGLLSYKITDEGKTSVRFIFLPVYAWIIILVVAFAAAVIVFRKRIMLLIAPVIPQKWKKGNNKKKK